MTANDRQTVGDTRMDAQIESILGQAAGESAITSPTPRETLDREEHLIRDAVLRMGSLVEASIREAAIKHLSRAEKEALVQAT